MNTPSQSAKESLEQPRRRWLAGLAVLGGLGLYGGAVKAQTLPWGRHHGGMDPQDMARRLDYGIGYLINELNGTPQQKERLVAIATAAQADMRPLRQQVRDARRQGLELLAAPTIDRRALEQLRVSQMQATDATSRRMVQAMADAADVLTPEQRTKMAQRMKERMERRGTR